jgi:hypothetical protein
VEKILDLGRLPMEARLLPRTASGPRTSPAMTTRLVVASVSQATRASGSAAM